MKKAYRMFRRKDRQNFYIQNNATREQRCLGTNWSLAQRFWHTDEMTDDQIEIAADRIKIIHEEFDNAPQFSQARSMLEQSKNICFLGFGFHPLNVKRLA